MYRPAQLRAPGAGASAQQAPEPDTVVITYCATFVMLIIAIVQL